MSKTTQRTKPKRILTCPADGCGFQSSSPLAMRAHYEQTAHKAVAPAKVRNRKRRSPTPAKGKAKRPRVPMVARLNFCPHCGKNLGVITDAMALAEQIKE
jgi:hypothetical protein